MEISARTLLATGTAVAGAVSALWRKLPCFNHHCGAGPVQMRHPAAQSLTDNEPPVFRSRPQIKRPYRIFLTTSKELTPDEKKERTKLINTTMLAEARKNLRPATLGILQNRISAACETPQSHREIDADRNFYSELCNLPAAKREKHLTGRRLNEAALRGLGLEEKTIVLRSFLKVLRPAPASLPGNPISVKSDLPKNVKNPGPRGAGPLKLGKWMAGGDDGRLYTATDGSMHFAAKERNAKTPAQAKKDTQKEAGIYNIVQRGGRYHPNVVQGHLPPGQENKAPKELTPYTAKNDEGKIIDIVVNDLIQGKTLDDFLKLVAASHDPRKNKFSPKQQELYDNFMQHVATVLMDVGQHMANANVSHGDMAACNIMLDRETGNLIVIDTGWSKLHKHAPEAHWKNEPTESRSPLAKMYAIDASHISELLRYNGVHYSPYDAPDDKLSLPDLKATEDNIRKIDKKIRKLPTDRGRMTVDQKAALRTLEQQKEKLYSRTQYSSLARLINRGHSSSARLPRRTLIQRLAPMLINKSDLDFEFIRDRSLSDTEVRTFIKEVLIRDRILKDDNSRPVLEKLREGESIGSNELSKFTDEILLALDVTDSHPNCALYKRLTAEIVEKELKRPVSMLKPETKYRSTNGDATPITPETKKLCQRAEVLLAQASQWEKTAKDVLREFDQLDARVSPAETRLSAAAIPIAQLEQSGDVAIVENLKEAVKIDRLLQEVYAEGAEHTSNTLLSKLGNPDDTPYRLLEALRNRPQSEMVREKCEALILAFPQTLRALRLPGEWIRGN